MLLLQFYEPQNTLQETLKVTEGGWTHTYTCSVTPCHDCFSLLFSAVLLLFVAEKVGAGGIHSLVPPRSLRQKQNVEVSS